MHVERSNKFGSLKLSVISKVQNEIIGICRGGGTLALVSSKCFNFLDFESCALIFSGDSGLLLKRTNPGSSLPGWDPLGYPWGAPGDGNVDPNTLGKKSNFC